MSGYTDRMDRIVAALIPVYGDYHDKESVYYDGREPDLARKARLLIAAIDAHCAARDERDRGNPLVPPHEYQHIADGVGCGLCGLPPSAAVHPEPSEPEQPPSWPTQQDTVIHEVEVSPDAAEAQLNVNILRRGLENAREKTEALVIDRDNFMRKYHDARDEINRLSREPSKPTVQAAQDREDAEGLRYFADKQWGVSGVQKGWLNAIADRLDGGAA